MQIILPMAGRGSRFADSAFGLPKPLIEVAGKPMLFWALDSLQAFDGNRLILVVLEEHEQQYGIRNRVQQYLDGRSFSLEVVQIPAVTEGQLCTVLAARHLLEDEEDVLIAASDTFIRGPLANDIRHKGADCAGLISVNRLPGEQWSFARADESGVVLEVAEKRRISEHASNGLYYFSRAADLIAYGENMIRNNERTRGEFFVIPVYQKMIEAGLKILLSHADEMWDMGTPEAKAAFEHHLQKK
ncbi:MAG: glycosyltransferase family 2 protein [Saprospiraceae bacterium]|nr:glycosyltransferase family 2 protein [Saprospiraceae bacterium]